MATRDSNESGYVLPLTALLIVPLLLFAALVVDVGAWFVRADQIQRTADSAALAGTVWLPDTADATDVALDVAARNGFRDPAWVAVNGGTANAWVDVSPSIDGRGLFVTIEAESPSYFGSVVLDKIDIQRRAVASVIPPVRMGNPSNALGTGNLDSSELGTTPDGVWLSLNGWCWDHQHGDPISVGRYGATVAGGSPNNTCTGVSTGPNPTLNPDGYTFIVDVPSGAGQVELEVFEPGLCTDTNTADLLYSAEDSGGGGPRLNFRVFANDDTELEDEDNLATTPVVETLYPTNACTGGGGAGGRWYHLYSIPAGAASEGRWYIQANVRQNTSETSQNMFALRARPVTHTNLCSSMSDPACPQLYAKDWLPIWRPPFGGAGQPAEFFLAEIPDEHAGRSVQFTIFDPGEGMDNIQFLDPSGTPVEFQQRQVNCSVGLICSNPTAWPETTDAAHDSCSGNPCLRVTSQRFQDQWVLVTADLPADYACPGNCWWRIRYTPTTTSTVNDRTTWSVRIIGGPVRLVE